MNTNQKRVREWMGRIPARTTTTRAAPCTELTEHEAILCARLMLEECLETIIDGLGVQVGIEIESMMICPLDFDKLHFQRYRGPDPVLIADGLADCEVVNQYTANVCGIDTQPVFDAVMDNNDLKIATGTVNKDGKLVKAPGHPKPDIAAVLRLQTGSESLTEPV